MKMFLYYMICFADGALVGYVTGFDHPVLRLISITAVIVFNTVVLARMFFNHKKKTKDVY